MTVEEMIKIVTPDAHIGGICLDTKECLQIIDALKAGQKLRKSVAVTLNAGPQGYSEVVEFMYNDKALEAITYYDETTKG